MAKEAIFGGTRGDVSHYSGPHRMHISRGRIWEDMPVDACESLAGDEQGRQRFFCPDFSYVWCSDVTADDTQFSLGRYKGRTAITATGTPAVTAVNGVLAITTGTATDDLYEILFHGGGAIGSAETAAPFTPVANTTIRFGAEIKIDTLALSQVVVGLSSDAAYSIASEPNNFVAIRLNKGSCSFRRKATGAAEATALLAPDGSANVSAGTFAEVGFVIRGVSAVEGYHDGRRTEISDVSALPTAGLYPFIYVENDATNSSTRTLSIRRWCVTQEIV